MMTTVGVSAPETSKKRNRDASGKCDKDESKDCEGDRPHKPFRAEPHYFMPDDIVWVRPTNLPYWPAEVTSICNNVATCRLFHPPQGLATVAADSGATLEAVVSSPCKKLFYFDKLASDEEIHDVIEERLNRAHHKVEHYESNFREAVLRANELVRIVLSPARLLPFEVVGVGVVHSFMRTHTSAPRQPSTKEFSPQTAVIVLRPGLENAVRDLKGFERIWVVFQFSYATGVKTDRQGSSACAGWKTMIVPPRDTVLRGVFATRSPHRPNSIGLSCVRLVEVRGLEVHIADHDLLHGTPVLDIKPYLPFCDAHPSAKAGWVQALDERGAGLGDHRGASGEDAVCVHRNYVAVSTDEGHKLATRHS